MSQENVEIVRRAWETRLSGEIEDVLDSFTDDCVSEDFPELPDHATYVGKEGVLEIDRHFREMWGELVQEPVEFIDAGDDLVVAVIAMRGHGKSSEAPLLSQAVFVHELRAGKLASMRAFTTKAQALEAAGLSEENVEITRKFFDAYNRSDLQGTLNLIAPEFEFRPSGLFMDTERTYFGPEGWSEFWNTFREAWESITVNLVRIEDLGDQVLTLGTFHGRGHGSGVEVTREVAWLGTVRDGLIAQSLTFVSWAEALEAAGLSE